MHPFHSHVAQAGRKAKLNHSSSRTLAALVGTIPVALGCGIALTWSLPLGLTERLTVGLFSVFPLWVAFACLVFLARSGRRAWIGLAGALVLCAAIALVASLLRTGTPFGVGS
jgi:hypothetical protein